MRDPRTASRPKKFTHLDTIQYEIDMLNYCYDQLRRSVWPGRESYYLTIEGFLLHYRNLCEFFSNRKELKASEPKEWAGRSLTVGELASIQDERLDKKYTGQISQYLSHCTKIRADRDRDWDILEMYEDIKPCLENFRGLFPTQPIPSTSIEILQATDASTSSLSRSVGSSDAVPKTK